MNAPNAALGCVLVFLAIIFVSLTIGHLFYFVAVILELAKNHWIAFPLGIIGLGYAACVMLAAQSK
jgi:hypothetical protein